jgi:hypothetical protein
MAELGSSKIYGNLTVSGDTDLKGQVTGLPAADLSAQGIVQLNNTLTSTSTEQALTAAQGKVLQDTKVSTTGNQTITGVKTFSSSPVVPTPGSNTDAVNKSYVDGKVEFFTVAVSTSDWTGTDPYIATKTVSGILATDIPIFDIDLSGVSFSEVFDIQNEWSFVYRGEAAANNEIKLYATADPAKNFSVQIKVIR